MCNEELFDNEQVMEHFKSKLTKTLESFYEREPQLEGFVLGCEPFGWFLDSCESLEHLEDWAGDYICNIKEQIDCLKCLIRELDEIQDEIIDMEEV